MKKFEFAKTGIKAAALATLLATGASQVDAMPWDKLKELESTVGDGRYSRGYTVLTHTNGTKAMTAEPEGGKRFSYYSDAMDKMPKKGNSNTVYLYEVDESTVKKDEKTGEAVAEVIRYEFAIKGDVIGNFLGQKSMGFYSVDRVSVNSPSVFGRTGTTRLFANPTASSNERQWVEEGDMGERGLQRFAFGLSQEDIVRSADEGINIGLDEYLTK